ncbi:LiaI-LiaF-like domain-containing protein [Chitinilyticum litopenaei]|uniref:LiaI-LiaF-like domain-containing protein n=1 Tax=Chitinilyticum litopenaei TaxID=1121276 RepID=UPI00040796FF|nr:DUF5668 domain-containing protein [Chitinilyticum litopenaei]
MQHLPLPSLILIAIGVFFLGHNFGLWSTELLARGWPLILIGLGIAGLLRPQRRCKPHSED